MIDVHIESNNVMYCDAHKNIKKLVKWGEKNLDKYFNVINTVDKCILVTSLSKVSTPTWFSFSALNACGTADELDSIISDEQLKSQLYKLADKAKGFTCTIESNESYPTGIYPCFKFVKDVYAYYLVINRTEISIYISKK